jgi:hypothetical protein
MKETLPSMKSVEFSNFLAAGLTEFHFVDLSRRGFGRLGDKRTGMERAYKPCILISVFFPFSIFVLF